MFYFLLLSEVRQHICSCLLNVAKQRLPKMNDLEFAGEDDIRLKSERKIYKFSKVIASSVRSFNMFTAGQHSLYLW